MEKNIQLATFYKSFLSTSNLKLLTESNKYNLELIFILFLLKNDNNHVIQLGNIDNSYENILTEKSEYKKINKKIFNNYNHNFNEDKLIIGNYNNTYNLLYNTTILDNIQYIVFFYKYNNINQNYKIRKLLINKYFYPIGFQYSENHNNKSIISKKKNLSIEIFSKGKINGLNEQLKLHHNTEIVDRTSIINHLISKYKLKNYLEIGVRDGVNIKKINIKNKIGVDPEPTDKIKNDKNIKIMTSDDYFKIIKNTNQKFDIIFIDGLHLDFQVDKDLINSLNHLNDKGFIIMHDCNPPTKFHQRVNYELKNGQKPSWNGTVWKSYVKLRMKNPNLNMCVVNCDWGIGIIQKGKQKCIKNIEDFKYNDLHLDRDNILNLISTYEFLHKF